MRLTARSVALLVAAGLALVLAVSAGIPALIPVVGLCLGLVVVTVVLAVVARPRLDVRRTIEPQLLEPDESAEVVLDVRVRAAWPVVVARWSDRVGSSLMGVTSGRGGPSSGRRSRWRYEVRGRRRGSHRIGPLDVVVTDAFGLVERGLTDAGAEQVVVLPRRRELAAPLGPTGSAGDLTPWHAASGLGQDDVTARPYLPGDALKRWHWKATAHRGRPMVRQEESQSRPTVLVVLDADPRVHDPAGFEWSVSGAASVVAHFDGRGVDLDLVSGSSVHAVVSGQGLRDALVSLALVEPSSTPVHLPARQRATFVFTGALDGSAAVRLLETVPSGDTVAFVARGTSDAAQSALAGAGWHVVVRETSDDLAELWATGHGATVR